MHGCELGGRGHGGDCVIHMLTTGLIGSLKAEGGQITCGDEQSERCIIRDAEEFGLGRRRACLCIAAEKVLEVRFTLSALQATSQLVEVVQLQQEGAVGEARAVVRGPIEADSKPVTELGELEEVFARLKAALEVGHHHKFATPRGFDSKDAQFDEFKVGQLQGEDLSELVLVKGEGLRRSLEGGLPFVCMTRSWPAYAGS
eukprot:6191275-Pleurochrysis_carterae.AAC.2